MNIFEDLKSEKENMDSKLDAFIKQKEIFERKWNDLSSALRNCKENSYQTDLPNLNYCQRNPKNVINTKVRCSFVMSPKRLTLPKSSKKNSSKSYCDPKANLIGCKTPVTSAKKINKFRKCYTPNSLSVTVDDQVKDIFGDM